MSNSPKAVPPALNGWSAEYLDEKYKAYLTDPDSVEAELRAFFQGFDLAQAGELELFGRGGTKGEIKTGGTGATGGTPVLPVDLGAGRGHATIAVAPGRPAGKTNHFQAIVDDLIDSYRDQGHLAAPLDPLGLDPGRRAPEMLRLDAHGLGENDMAHPVDGQSLGLSATAPLSEVVARLEAIYCGTMGVEFMHIQNFEQRRWLFERYETIGGRLTLDSAQKGNILEQLTRSEMFEQFLARRYPGEKRFSLEGAESLIPLLDHVISSGCELGVEEIVMGMSHRGRLNVLNNILGKTYEQIFTEFEDLWEDDFDESGGDVKYHQGYSGTRRMCDGRMVHLAMASNPSHLESVGGVVQGRCRAKQRLRADFDRDRVIALQIHGDAAVIGQGVVQEILNFSQLEGYTTGGTIHVVVNNQIGFTTLPADARSTRYCTDIGKMVDAPIFHVNGDDPEAVVTAAQIAIEFRQKFNRDVFIDLVCYRKYGHNEQDETSFTQPIMAAAIKRKPSTLRLYSDRLEAEGVIGQADTQSIQSRLDEMLEKAQVAARKKPDDPTIDPGSARWAGLTHEWSFEPGETAVSMNDLEEVCAALGRVPDGFKINPKLKRLLDARAKLPQTKQISYADAEALAWGTLLAEGHPIRVSGQDSRRGTFSHRHAVVRDMDSGEPFIPLNNICELGILGTDKMPGSLCPSGKARQAKLCIYDSPLSEASVLGFDYGYSLGDPSMLVCWEAQFGDFANGAQVIIDQYIASAEAKWGRWSGLVVLLPHGYEGAGPEHSSARMERFLKICGGNNMQVVYPTTGGQVFHMFRRQLKRGFRKPLVVMTPKSMLRVATGSIEDLTSGGFREFLDDPMFAGDDAGRKKVKRVVLCCGKVYWELDARRRELGRADIALLRVEQVHPFHGEMLAGLFAQYPESAERCYVQEEPYNAAAYLFMNNKCENELGMDRLRYIGRASAATPATGSKKQHKAEQEAILTEAVGPKPEAGAKKTEQKLKASA